MNQITNPSPVPLQSKKISRRALTLPFLLTPLIPQFPSLAQSNEENSNSISTTSNLSSESNVVNPVINDLCTNPPICAEKAFLDVSIDGEPAGRIVIGLYGETTPFGSSRFSGLVSGSSGISYRRKEFVKIMPNYVQHAGVRSYGVDVELAQRTGSDISQPNNLITEWESTNKNCAGTKNLSGSVSIVVRNPNKPAPKPKLVARKGKLEIDQEQVGLDPNGTEFVIAMKDAPELDESSLVVGKVLQGMDVVRKIALVKTVKDNTSSPYFRVAKLIGDKRAVVAERGFNRPYSKVIITNCGVID